MSSEREDRDAADASVVEHWVAGDDDALRLAYDQFAPLVLTYCKRSLSDQNTALDCVQETFVSAWRSRQRFDPARGAFGAWLLGIARYRVMDAYRAHARTPTPIEDLRLDDTVGQDRPHSDEIADQLLIARALDALKPRVRRVVELAFYSDLTQHDIAEKLELPLGTVKSDLRRGLEVMRRHLEGRQIGPRTTAPRPSSTSASPAGNGPYDA